jgi:uncharacterized RDD family membrane protein YckC
MPWVATVKAKGRRPLGRLRFRILGDAFDFIVASMMLPGVVGTALRSAGVEDWRAAFRFGWIGVLIYTVIPVALTGATVGKKLVGQRVEHYSEATVPGLTTSFVRYVVATGLPIGIIGAVVPALALAASLVSLAWLLVILLSIVADTERRGVHDRLAGTVVVQTP